MRDGDLTTTLELAQKRMGAAICKVVLTKTGLATQTYDNYASTNRLLPGCRHHEEQYSQTATIVIDNRENNLTGLNLLGYVATISYGYDTGSAEWSACAPLKVIAQTFFSSESDLICTLTCEGLGDQMNRDRSAEHFDGLLSDTDTVKDRIDQICTPNGTDLAVAYDHTEDITTSWDVEDWIVGSVTPKDMFEINFAQSRLSLLQKWVGNLGVDCRFEGDGNLHFFMTFARVWQANYAYILGEIVKPTLPGDWVANTVYAANARVKPTTENGYYYICTTGGTSHASTEPTWPTKDGDTKTDGTVTWTCRYSNYIYECIGAGTTDASEPSWTYEAFDTISDNTAEWQLYYDYEYYLDASLTSEILRPNAAGDETNLGAQVPVTGSHYDKVDEVTADDNTTRVVDTSTSYQRDLYNIGAHTLSGPIASVTVYARCLGATAVNQASLKICIKSGGTAYEDTADTITTSWANYSHSWTTNPRTSEVWSWGDIDGLQIGVSMRDCNTAGGSNYRSQCTQVWAVVTLDTPHNFFSKEHRERIVMPNKVTVQSDATHVSQYTGNATEAGSFSLLPIEDFVTAYLASNQEGTDIAEAMIDRAARNAQHGSARVPLNVVQEVLDYVRITDSRQDDFIQGRIMSITRYPIPNFVMDLSFSPLAPVMMGRLDLLSSPPPPEPIPQWATNMQDEIYENLNKIIDYINEVNDNSKLETPDTAKIKDRLADDGWSEVGSPLVDTDYQNTTGKLKLVTITMTAGGASGDYGDWELLMGSSAAPTTKVALLTVNRDNGPWHSAISFIVPVNYYYHLNTLWNVNSGIGEWHEWDLF